MFRPFGTVKARYPNSLNLVHELRNITGMTKGSMNDRRAQKNHMGNKLSILQVRNDSRGKML